MAGTLWSSPAMPSTLTRPAYCAPMSCTSGAWPMHVAHHGAQNQRITGLPASVAASNGWPSSVLPVNFNDAGTTAGPPVLAVPAGLVFSSRADDRADDVVAPAHPAASI